MNNEIIFSFEGNRKLSMWIQYLNVTLVFEKGSHVKN